MLVGGALATRGVLRAATHAARVVLWRLRAGTAAVAAAAGLAVRGRIVIMVVGLVLGVALVVNLAAIHASVERSVGGLLARELRGDLLVTSAHTRGGWIPAPLAGTLEQELAAVPGVTRIVTVRSIEQPDGDGRLRIRAVGGALDDAALADALIVAGDPRQALAALRAGTGVAISRTLALHQRRGVGDAVRVATPSGARDLRVAAVITDLSSHRGTITMERGLYRRLWHDDLVDVFELAVAPGVDPRDVMRTVRRRLEGRHQVQVRLVAEHRRERVAAVGRAFAFTGAVELLTALVMLVGLGDNLLAGVRERTRELALLRALGATRLQVGLLIGQESLLLGLVGGLFGLALGTVVALAWLRLALPDLIGFAVDLHLPVGAGLSAVAASVLLAVAAAAVPAWRGSGVSAAESLKRAE
jgi:putative ABC transport system permease protein